MDKYLLVDYLKISGHLFPCTRRHRALFQDLPFIYIDPTDSNGLGNSIGLHVSRYSLYLYAARQCIYEFGSGYIEAHKRTTNEYTPTSTTDTHTHTHTDTTHTHLDGLENVKIFHLCCRHLPTFNRPTLVRSE